MNFPDRDGRLWFRFQIPAIGVDALIAAFLLNHRHVNFISFKCYVYLILFDAMFKPCRVA